MYDSLIHNFDPVVHLCELKTSKNRQGLKSQCMREVDCFLNKFLGTIAAKPKMLSGNKIDRSINQKIEK